MNLDYHIHSLHSDGIYTIEELFSLLVKHHVSSFAITDHDTIDGIAKAKQLAQSNLNFLTGIEFTCKEYYFPTLQKSYSIHLLGYDFDENNQSLLNRLQQRKIEVKQVFSSLCEELTKKGYPIKIDDVLISCGNVLQLCDITAHIKKNYPDCKDEIYQYIDSYAQKLTNVNISIEEAIHLLHNANGKAVWAHPFCVYKDFHKISLDKEIVQEILSSLLSLGIDGIEAIYSSFCEEDRQWLIEQAKKHALCYTAGSDFHGSKGRDKLGMHLASSIQLL